MLFFLVTKKYILVYNLVAVYELHKLELHFVVVKSDCSKLELIQIQVENQSL